MKKSLIAVLFIIFTLFSYSKEYYIGDKIKFKIETDKSESKIKEAFKEFEIEKIEKQDNGYIVTVLTFTTGKKKIVIDKNKFELDIKSAVDVKDNKIVEELDEDSSNLTNENINGIPYTFIIIIAILIFACCLVVIIIKFYKRMNKNPYAVLEREIEAAKKRDYFMDSVISFKNYIEKKSKLKISDKTTSESEEELKKWILSYEELNIIVEIMKSADIYKFMQGEYNRETIDGHSKKIMESARKIEEKLKKKAKGDGNNV